MNVFNTLNDLDAKWGHDPNHKAIALDYKRLLHDYLSQLLDQLRREELARTKKNPLHDPTVMPSPH